MPGRESPIERAGARNRQVLAQIGRELRTARLGLGLSLAAIGGRVSMSTSKVSRVERGAALEVSLHDLALLAAAVGLDLGVRLYPGPRVVRDEAHRRLLGRLRAVLHVLLGWRTEVPLPSAGDRRAWDAVIAGPGFRVAVEAETRLVDIQALERRIALKRRDGGIDHVILLVSDTRLNRDALRAAGPLAGFPIPARAALDALRRGTDPGGSAVIFM